MTSKLFSLHHTIWRRTPFPFFRGGATGKFISQNNRLLSSQMKPWEKPVYACDGDYRKEVFLEAHVGGPLYKEQKNMPRLPIPTLEDTIERFLPTALPLARTKEEEFALKEACKSFPEQAKALHERLNKKREHEMKDSSWLQVWWNQVSFKGNGKDFISFIVASHKNYGALVGLFTSARFGCP